MSFKNLKANKGDDNQTARQALTLDARVQIIQTWPAKSHLVAPAQPIQRLVTRLKTGVAAFGVNAA